MKAKTPIDPVPPSTSVNLTAQFEAVRADVRKAQDEAAAAEAKMVECAVDPVAFDEAKVQAKAATAILGEHRTRLDALTKLLEKHNSAEYLHLRDWLQRRADRTSEKVKADLAAVVEDRRTEGARHKAATMILDHREQVAKQSEKEAELHAVSVFKIGDAAAARIAAEAAQELDELNADPALGTCFGKLARLDARIIDLCANQTMSNSEEIAAAKRERAEIGTDWDNARSRASSCRKAIMAALEIKL